MIRRAWPLLLAAALLALALVLPPVELPRAAYRYLFVFDITQSMNVADAAAGDPPPRRLAFARQAVSTVLQSLPCGTEIGLGLFSGHRTLVLFAPVEVCRQRRELLTMVAAVDWKLAWKARSEVAKGLFDALEAAGELGAATAVVFLSDGHEAPPVHPEYRPRFRGEPGRVKGLIVGVGGLRPLPIPKLDGDDKVVGYWQPDEVQQVDSYSLGRAGTSIPESMVGVEAGDLSGRIRGGSEHLSSLREDYLRRLARDTGLAYLRLERPDALAARLTASDLAFRERRLTDLRGLPAALALALVAVGYLPRRRRRRQQASP